MKRIWKIVLRIALLVVIIIAGALVYLTVLLPGIKYDKNLKVEITPERVARGDYLANHVTVCMDCHSTRDWSRFSAPLVQGTLGKGGEIFDQSMGLPGRFVSPNITPFNLKDYSDGEIYRAITAGVGKGGRALFPVMPYHSYGRMDKEDVYSIIAYIRTISPIDFTPEKSKADFPVNILVNTMPSKGNPEVRPSSENVLDYGKYLTNASGCIECHTPISEKGQLIMEKSFTGGREFPLGDGKGKVTSANITPHKTTGIGQWTKETFVARFKAYDPESFNPPIVQDGQFQTIMPWTMYAGMTESDLEAIFTYLSSLQPVENKVVTFSEK